MKAIIKEQGRTYTYEHVNYIEIDDDTNTCTINYQDENDEECEEFGSMCPDFELQLCMGKNQKEE